MTNLNENSEDEIISKVKAFFAKEARQARLDKILNNKLDQKILEEIKFYILTMAKDAQEIKEGWRLYSQQQNLDSELPLSPAILSIFFEGTHNVLGEIDQDSSDVNTAIAKNALLKRDRIIANINFIGNGLKFSSNGENCIFKIDYEGNIEIIKSDKVVYFYKSYFFTSWDTLRKPNRTNDLKIFHSGVWILDFLKALSAVPAQLEERNKASLK